MLNIPGFHPNVDAEECVVCKNLIYITKGSWFSPKVFNLEYIFDKVFCCDACSVKQLEKNKK